MEVLPQRWHRRRVGARTLGRVQQRRERRCWSMCALRSPSRVPCALGEGVGERMIVPFPQSPSVRAGISCPRSIMLKAVCSQQLSSLGGNELSAIQMHVPVSLQRGVMQVGPWGAAKGLEPAVGWGLQMGSCQAEGPGPSQPGSIASRFINHSEDQILPHHHHCEIKLNLEIKKGLRNCYNRWPMHLL